MARRSSGSHPNALPNGNRPLYAAAASATVVSTTTGNAGLWYDKFCDRWKPDWTGFAGDSGKRDWITQIANIGAGKSEKKVGDRALMKESCQMLRRSRRRRKPAAVFRRRQLGAS